LRHEPRPKELQRYGDDYGKSAAQKSAALYALRGRPAVAAEKRREERRRMLIYVEEAAFATLI